MNQVPAAAAAQYEKYARPDNLQDTLIGDKLGCQGRFISGRRTSETVLVVKGDFIFN
jgi:hypothetical protein